MATRQADEILPGICFFAYEAIGGLGVAMEDGNGRGEEKGSALVHFVDRYT